jgi:hypothetical protein
VSECQALVVVTGSSGFNDEVVCRSAVTNSVPHAVNSSVLRICCAPIASAIHVAAVKGGPPRGQRTAAGSRVETRRST